MPTIRLATQNTGPVLPVVNPGGPVTIHTPQFRCLVRLPNTPMPKDAVIDTGAPLVFIPPTLWTRFREGIDFEWLPFAPGFQPPAAQLPSWRFTFTLARFLAPLGVMDYSNEVDRPDVIAAFADTDPAAPRTRLAPPPIVIGLWGGLLEGGKVAVGRTAAGRVEGLLEYP